MLATKEDFRIETGNIERLRKILQDSLSGQADAIELSLIALISGGHILLEGPPGVGKTSLAQAIAASFRAVFRRIQMTSDLLPSDIVGTLRLKPGAEDLEFRQGPVFCNVLLADELNRASAKTQSALLEAMAEGKVTVDGTTHDLPAPFFVIATQNPQEFQGVYPLSESQLDRFMIHISLDVPGREAELELFRKHAVKEKGGEKGHEAFLLSDLLAMRRTASSVFVEESVIQFLQKLAAEVRQRAQVSHGASVRASLQLLDASKARALLKGRDFVIPEDIKVLAPAVLGHRLCLKGLSNSSEQKKEIVKDALETVVAPN